MRMKIKAEKKREVGIKDFDLYMQFYSAPFAY